MMGSSKPKRNETLKTASIYAVLFIVTSMSTSALWMPKAAAVACVGIETVRYFATGHNDDSGPMLGTKAASLITSLPVCTGAEEYGSVGGSIVWITAPSLQLAETGF
jgi:hypothetical protein